MEKFKTQPVHFGINHFQELSHFLFSIIKTKNADTYLIFTYIIVDFKIMLVGIKRRLNSQNKTSDSPSKNVS